MQERCWDVKMSPPVEGNDPVYVIAKTATDAEKIAADMYPDHMVASVEAPYCPLCERRDSPRIS